MAVVALGGAVFALFAALSLSYYARRGHGGFSSVSNFFRQGSSLASASSRKGEDDEVVVYAIGDLHGDLMCARRWVERTNTIVSISDELSSWEWRDPRASLVFVGDYIDK